MIPFLFKGSTDAGRIDTKATIPNDRDPPAAYQRDGNRQAASRPEAGGNSGQCAERNRLPDFSITVWG